MNYSIRKLKEKEQEILADFLYEAIYIPKGVKAPPRNIIEQPELKLYISDWEKRMIIVLWLKQIIVLLGLSGLVL